MGLLNFLFGRSEPDVTEYEIVTPPNTTGFGHGWDNQAGECDPLTDHIDTVRDVTEDRRGWLHFHVTATDPDGLAAWAADQAKPTSVETRPDYT